MSEGIVSLTCYLYNSIKSLKKRRQFVYINLCKKFTESNIGFYFLIIATIGDILIPFILALFCKNYNHRTMVMSLLGAQNSPVHILYDIWLVTAGLMFLCGNFCLYNLYADKSSVLASCLFIVLLIYAVGGCILSGIFPVDETKELSTISAKIHGFGSVLGFFVLTFAPLIIGILSINSNDLINGIVSIIFFILAVLFFVLFVMADKQTFAGTFIANEGLWQRLTLLCMYAPVCIVAFKKICSV